MVTKRTIRTARMMYMDVLKDCVMGDEFNNRNKGHIINAVTNEQNLNSDARHILIPHQKNAFPDYIQSAISRTVMTFQTGTTGQGLSRGFGACSWTIRERKQRT